MFRRPRLFLSMCLAVSFSQHFSQWAKAFAMDSDDRLAAARKAAARMAASAVFAGRSAAVAVQSRDQLSMQTFEARNRRHNLEHMEEHLEHGEHLEDHDERQRSDSVARRVAKANQAVAAAALRAQTTHNSEYRSPGPKPVSSPRVPNEQSDGLEMS